MDVTCPNKLNKSNLS